MARLERGVAAGRLEIVSRTEEEAKDAAEIALEAWSRGPRHAAFLGFSSGRAYFKQSAFTGKTRLRYALKRGLLRRPLPRLCEYRNLLWLRARGFRAPEPLAAGALWRSGLPRFQFLFTREVPGARTLEAFLRSAIDREGRIERGPVLAELARETARMHALGFVHHDLFPRNVLVTAAPENRVWFLDCWAGGPPPQVRGPTYDLACLTLREDGSFTAQEREGLFETYFAARTERDRGFDSGRFLRSVARHRETLARKTPA